VTVESLRVDQDRIACRYAPGRSLGIDIPSQLWSAACWFIKDPSFARMHINGSYIVVASQPPS